MKYYGIAEINITDPKWVPEYTDKVTKMVEKVGGRYLARTSDIVVLEGDTAAPNVALLVEFPSKQVAEEFYNSKEYAPFVKARKAGSNGSFFLVAGKDDTGQASR